MDAVRAAVAGDPEIGEVTLVTGGDRRQDSVAAGLRAVNDADIVVIHDGARPLVTQTLIEEAVTAVERGADAAITAVPLSDTIKRTVGDTIETVNRTDMWRSQTPQAFRTSVLMQAIERSSETGTTFTDEAMMVEMNGGRVAIVPGDERNIKLTVSTDAELVNALAHVGVDDPVMTSRTGIGYDVHRLVSGRKLMIGGVEIPFGLGLDGHSDADVLLARH